QNAYLIETPEGNILWDLVALIDEATIAEIEARGGIKAIAISHAHYYTTMVEWSHALGHVPIFLHDSNRQWVMRPDSVVEYWSGDTLKPIPGITVIRTGGHFPGGMVLHWSGTPDGRGALFTGDIVKVVADPNWVTFMYSYPNTIPLDPATVARMATQLARFRFDRVHDAFDKHVATDGNRAIQRSAERYISHVLGHAGPTIG
ncbi:MAG TPA: hypothetical protein VFQ54_01875, partial [Thermomicrobiales bacterium]|nr:hypothetical protein [Thermomicrobiales bacterium]